MAMTPKQQKLADKYLECGNATEAAKYAGYSPKNIGENAAKTLKNPNVSAYIAERMAEMQKPTIASAEEVLTVITQIMRSENTNDRDRLKAAELMGKRYALYSDKVQVDGAVPVMFAGEDDLHD